MRRQTGRIQQHRFLARKSLRISQQTDGYPAAVRMTHQHRLGHVKRRQKRAHKRHVLRTAPHRFRLIGAAKAGHIRRDHTVTPG